MINFVFDEIVGDIQIGLIQANGLQKFIVLTKDRLELFAGFAVLCKVWLDKNDVRTQLLSDETWNSRTHTIPPSNIVSSHNHIFLSYSYWFLCECRIISHLDCSIESIEVNMYPSALQVEVPLNLLYLF